MPDERAVHMLLERTDLERRLAQIVATTMPGHGGDAPDEGTVPDERDPDADPTEAPPS
jgi:hypothetical protein